MFDHYGVKDFSCMFAAPMAYLDLIRERLERTNKENQVILSETEVTAFIGMLYEADDFFSEVERALYPKNTKSASNNIDRDNKFPAASSGEFPSEIERYAITTKPDLDHIGKTAAEALEYFDNGEHDSVRDLIIEIHKQIYPNAWQPVKR